MHLTLPRPEDAQELAFVLFMRKFYADDTVAQLSLFINDCIEELCAAHPVIHTQFDDHRGYAADAFVAACQPERDPNLWAYLAERPTEAERLKVIADFFTPIRPTHAVPLTTPKEIANAYRA